MLTNRERRNRNKRRHEQMMTGLGFKGGLRNHATYLKRLEASKRWNKLNRHRTRIHDARYAAKKNASDTPHNRYIFVAARAPAKLAYWKRRRDAARKELLRIQEMSNKYRGRRPLRIDA